MIEYVKIRASEILDQEDLVAFLKSRFPKATTPAGRHKIMGTECVDICVPSNSPEFEEIQEFIKLKKRQGLKGFLDFHIGRYIRKYAKAELENAEILRLTILPHFEPSGEECGTIYETLCDQCNLGRQVSDLVLKLKRIPKNMDIAETIAWDEWVVSSKFVRAFTEHKLTGAEFLPVFDTINPMKQSNEWYQLRVNGGAVELHEATKFGKDPFTPDRISWRCPLGHSIVTEFLSEIYLQRSSWRSSDIAVTSTLFGQGRNLLRPTPLILISQRMYRVFQEMGIKGLSYEIARLL
jgi:hypothetical protein